MNIKSILLVIALAAFAFPVFAQRDNHSGQAGKPKEISEIVNDLTPAQKKRLDAITDASKERVAAMRARQKALRDSIRVYMHLEGDHSAELFPLFDQEASLQRDISREMYTTKVCIDEVLTPAQRQQVRQASTRQRQGDAKKKRKK